MNIIYKIHQPGLSCGVLIIAGILVGSLILVKPAGAVTISQPIVEINADPGETIEQTVQLYDDSMQGVAVYPWVYNFTEDASHEGSVQLLTKPADLKPDRAWVTFDTNRLELPADGSLVSFPYRLELPDNAEPGTHLIALTFRSRPPMAEEQEGSIVYVGSNVVTSIFLKVSGDIVDKIEADFQSGTYTNHDASLSPAERKQYFKPKKFFIKPPVEFLLTVDNQGNTHQKPDGNVRVVNDLFKSDPEKLLINPENRIILPDDDRTFSVPSFGEGFMIGKYRAKLTLLYGSPLRALNKEISFWIIPVVELLIALGIILLILLMVVLTWYILNKRKERKERERERQRELNDYKREQRLRQEIIEDMRRQKEIDEQNKNAPNKTPPGQSPP